jgi:hypothetical protein
VVKNGKLLNEADVSAELILEGAELTLDGDFLTREGLNVTNDLSINIE